jgi:hypothetical protein
MVDVFDEATGDYKARGLLAYLAFLCNEFAGIVAGAFVLRKGEITRSFVISAVGGAAITAFCQAVLFSNCGIGNRLSIEATAPADIVMPLILAGICLLLICVLSALFVWNLRNVRRQGPRI